MFRVLVIVALLAVAQGVRFDKLHNSIRRTSFVETKSDSSTKTFAEAKAAWLKAHPEGPDFTQLKAEDRAKAQAQYGGGGGGAYPDESNGQPITGIKIWFGQFVNGI